MRKFESTLRMRQDAITLDLEQRQLVERTISEHCCIRQWKLHAVNCRTNHVHVVVSAIGRPIDVSREQFKAWCSRKLSDIASRSGLPRHDNWWTQRGWDEFVDDANSLAETVEYVENRQGPRAS